MVGFCLTALRRTLLPPNKQDKEYVLESLRSFVPRLKSLFTASLIKNYQLKKEEHDANGWYQESYREINGGRFEMKLFYVILCRVVHMGPTSQFTGNFKNTTNNK